MKHKIYLKPLQQLICCLSYLLVIMGICVTNSYGQTVVVNPASPFTVPSGVTSLKVEVWGGGGGGGGAIGGFLNTAGAGGGGGGAYKTATLAVSGGQSYTITIGAAGAAGAIASAGGTGGTTTVTGPAGTVTVNGGSGGAGANGSNSAGGAGGTGGTFNGGNGGASSGNGAGGGGGAGNNAAGGNGGNAATGTGGAGNPNVVPYIGGNGGAFRTGNGAGNAGNTPSGGGGGGRAGALFGSNNGGAGAAGQVVLTYTIPPCTTPPVGGTASGPASGCVSAALSYNVAGGSGTYQWQSATVSGGPFTDISGSTNATYNIASANTGTGYYRVKRQAPGCTDAFSNVITTSITSAPTVAPAIAPASVCAGNQVNLTSNAVLNLSASDLEAGLNSWTAINNSTGGTPAAAAWTIQTNPYVYSGTTFNSGSGTKFIITNSDAQGAAGTTNTILQSPSFSTVGFTQLSLKYKHYFKSYSGSTAFVEVSTNGTSWTILSSFTTDQGGAAAFTNVTTSLNTYVGNPNVFIRFRYSGSFGWYWALDNISISVPNPTLTYAWSSSFSGFSSSSANPSDNPTSAGTYTVAAANGTCSSSGNIAVAMKAAPQPSASTNAPVCNGENLLLFGSNSASGQSSGNTYAWSGPNSFTSSLPNPPLGSAGSVHAGTYTLTITNSLGCTSSTTTSVVVNPNPVVSLATQTNVSCNGLSDGSVDIDATSGTVPYLFDLNGNSTLDGIYSGLPAGNYPASVTDDNGCVSATPLSVQVTQPAVLGFSLTSANTTCPATSDGSIQVTATGGTPNYQYSHDDGSNFQSSNVFSNLSPGNYDVIVRDAHNCVTSPLAVTIIASPDVLAPVPNSASLPNVTGECSATAAATPTATDNCAGSITATTTDALSYNVEGSYVIHWNYDDGNGNISSQNQTVIVDDVTAPVPDAVSLATISGECSATVAAVPTATDNCTGIVTATTSDATSYNAQGTYTVHWIYNDGKGNTFSQNQAVIVDDVTAPVPDAASLAIITAECSATIAAAPTATDNCTGTITATTSDPTIYSTEGTYVIHWNFDDGNGNIASQSQSVIIDDVTAPVPDVASLAAISAECISSVTAPMATDNCVGSITATTSDPSSYIAEGTYTLHWVYDDGNGNTTAQNQTVIIDDVTAPVPDVASLPAITGECSASAIAPTATDNCSGVITGTTNDLTSYNSQGTYTIHWNYDDGKGNSLTQNQTVIVDDVTAPVINSIPSDFSSCNPVSWTVPTANDNCGSATLTSNYNPGVTLPTGTTTITYTADDGNGNTSSTSFHVTLIPSPSAIISGNINNCLGNPALVHLNLTGLGPWNYTVSDGSQTVSGSTSLNSIDVPVTPATTGSHTYTVTSITDANCSTAGTSSGSAIVHVSSAPPSNNIGSVNGPQGACNGDIVLITTNSVGGQNIRYSWNTGSNSSGVLFSASPGGPFISGPFQTTTNSVYAQFGILAGSSGYNVCVQGINGCGSTNNKCDWIRGVVGTPGTISGSPVACSADTKNYSAGTSGGATAYNWTFSVPGAVINNNGTQNVSVTFPAFTSGQLCVTASLACGGSSTSAARCMTISNNPAVPGTMTGPNKICPGSTNISYSVPAVAGATGYNWTVPPGASIVETPPYTNSIHVNFPGSYNNSPPVCVTALGDCGASVSRCKNVSSGLPGQPGAMTGPTNNVCNSTVQYSVPNNPLATSYTWTIPAGATGFVGQGSTSIQFNVASNFTSGYVSVVANSTICAPATSPARTVTIHGAPSMPGTITSNPSAWCDGGSVNFSIIPVSPLPNYLWIVTNGTIDAGQNSSNIDATWGTGSGFVKVRASNTCGVSGLRTQTFSSAGCREEENIFLNADSKFGVYPNPAHDNLTVTVDVKESTKYTVQLTDLSGRIMLSENADAENGINRYEINLSHISKGAYILTLQSENDSWKTKVVIE